MNARLSLHDSRMAAEDLQELTAELLRSIHQETEVTARLPEESAGAGVKGDPVSLGELLLAALSSGTVVALLQVLKSYIERKPTMRFMIERPDGKKVELEMEHFRPKQLTQTLEAMQQFCEDK